jgi:hypothetical protein
MKKNMFGVAIIATVILLSCKKADRVCECTLSDGTKSQFTIVDKTTKKSAEYFCKTQGGDNMNDQITSSAGTETDSEDDATNGTCKLK